MNPGHPYGAQRGLHTGAGGSKTGGAPAAAGWELFLDPHFVFTIISLCLSVSVFFYYLYQLLCASAQESRDEVGKAVRADAAAEAARIKAARERLDRKVAQAADRVEARQAAAAAATAKSSKALENEPKAAAAEPKRAPDADAAAPANQKAASKDGDAGSASGAAANQRLRQRKVESK